MADPWELLKRAREELGTIEALTLHPKFHNGEGGDELTNFLAEIDSALAGYEKEKGWVRHGRWANYNGEYGTGFVCHSQVPLDSPFFWRINRMDNTWYEGHADSFEEAREKANTALRNANG